MRWDLLTVFVPKNEGDRITSALRDAGAEGATVTRATTWLDSALLQLLGIAEKVTEIVFCAASEEKLAALREAVIKETAGERKKYGCLFSINLTHMYRGGKPSNLSCKKEENSMKTQDKSRDLITVILNKGFADDAMAAAREAGAGGGTVLHGRGTALPEDASFFGITLVPEKEILLILTEREKTEDILAAMGKLPCLMQPGSGIAFCMEAEGFVNLGQQED